MLNATKYSLLKIKSILLLVVLCALINSCAKPVNVKWVYYDETQCADKWVITNNNEVLKDRVVEHLKSNGIKVYQIEIFTDRSPEACTS